MTLIAAFRPQGCPTLFGDLLLSGHERVNDQVSIPTIGDVRNFYPEGSGWSITGLQQKIVLVSDNCAIAWAGSWLGARIAIGQLRDLASTQKLTAPLLRDFMDNMNEDTVNLGTSFVGLLISDDQVLYFKHDAEYFEDPGVGSVFVEGTGKRAFREILATGIFTKLELSGDPNPVDVAASTGLMIAGMLLRNEHASGSNLLEYFGGGYEVAVHTVNGFKKLGNMTFIMWEASVKRDLVDIAPLFIVKQQYADDVLLLRSAMLRSANGFPTVVDEQLHAILPIYKNKSEVGLPAPADVPYQSPLLCHCFLVRSNAQVAVHTRIQRSGPNSEPAMTFGDANGQLVLGFNPIFIQQVYETLKRGGQPR